MAADGRKTLWYVAGAVVVVIAVLTAIGAVTDKGEDKPTTDEGELSAAATQAGCLPVERERPIPPGGKHKAPPIEYDDAPPSSGEHAPNTLRNAKRFYTRDDDPAPEQAVHDLEHGLVVAWYDDELPDDQVAELERVSQGMGARYVAVPWTRGTFSGSQHFVLTAWGVKQRCAQVNSEHIQEFIEDFADTDAPEKGYSV